MVRNEHDIDALKQAEAKLREDERALRRHHCRDTSKHVVLDPDGSPIYGEPKRRSITPV